MQCNIDAKGKRLRLISGLITLAFAGGFLFWGHWIVGAVVVAIGLFQVFEARAGWCVMRAMGFKTPA